MQISEWNRNTSLLALQLSVDYLLGSDNITSSPEKRNTKRPPLFPEGRQQIALPRTRKRITSRLTGRVEALAD